MRITQFHLENAIKAWRHTLRLRRTFLEDDLDELEDHLRKEIQKRVEQGISEKEAFLSSSEMLGTQVELENAYQPVRFGKNKRARSVLNETMFSVSMLSHYIHIALRSFRRQFGQTVINVVGLSVALLACLLVGLYVQDEMSYDQFHEQADQIYRVRTGSEGNWQGMLRASMSETLRSDYSDVEASVRIFKHWETPLVSKDERGFYEPNFFFADNSLFQVFSFNLIRGNPREALKDPYSIVITERTARKYFGEQDPIGQTIVYNTRHELTVTGVLADTPENSHLHPDFVASMSTLPSVSYGGIMEEWQVFYTYVRLKENSSINSFKKSIEPLRSRMAGENASYELDFQPLSRIHLYSKMANELEPNGDYRFVLLMAVVGLLILIIASINHVNLATARAMKRAREVAVRKVSGAKRHEIIQQFYVEAFVLVFSSLLVAVVLMAILGPFFGAFIGKPDILSHLSVGLVAGGLMLTVAMGLLAGGYPAIFLSRYVPAEVLKGSFMNSVRGRKFRNILVVTQFAVSAVLIVVTMVVFRQMSHIQTADIGFDAENVVTVPVPGIEARGQYQTLRNALMDISSVSNLAATASTYPGERHSGGHSLRRPEQGISTTQIVQRNWVDAHYFSVLGIQMRSGKTFELEATRNSRSLILNEAAARLMGWTNPAEAIGESILLNPDSDSLSYSIIGVSENYNFESLHSEIGPLVFTPTNFPTVIVARLKSGSLSSTIAEMQEVWNQVTGQPFNYSFLDEELSELYMTDARWGGMLRMSTMFALFIASLGLLGLAAFMAESRKREIGIRKALGATSAGIVMLISKDFVRLILLAIVVAAPLSYLASQEWLSSFAFQTEIGIDVFIVGALILLGIGGLTVSFHATKAALADPSKSLRSSE